MSLASFVGSIPSVLACLLCLYVVTSQLCVVKRCQDWFAKDCTLPLVSLPDGKPRPMSSWNVAALLSLRESLKLNVLMNTGLSDKLEEVAGGFMSQREAQMVRGLPTSSDQVDRVIETLRGKTDDDFQIFCQMLRNSNQDVWADELERLSEQFKQGGGNGMCARRKQLTGPIYGCDCAC